MTKLESQGPKDTIQPVLVIEKEPKDMSYMELRDAFKVRGFKQNEIIKLMAERLIEKLGDRFTKPQIKDKIVEDLGEYSNDAYVRKVLGPEFTQQKFSSASAKKAMREAAKEIGGRSDLKVTIVFTEDLMDAIDDARGEDSVQKFIIKTLKERLNLDA